MSEPNDQLEVLRKRAVEHAEEGLSLMAAAYTGNIFDARAFANWSRISQSSSGKLKPSEYLGHVLSALPKGTSLCIK